MEGHLARVFKERLQLSGIQQGLGDQLHYQDLRPVHGIYIWVSLTYGQVTLELAVDFGGLGSPRLHFLLPLQDPLPDDLPVLHLVGLTGLCGHVHIGLLIHLGLGEHGLVDGIGGHCCAPVLHVIWHHVHFHWIILRLWWHLIGYLGL